jgi:hypothetical protein
LQPESGETKVNSRHTVNLRKMAKMAPTELLGKGLVSRASERLTIA